MTTHAEIFDIILRHSLLSSSGPGHNITLITPYKKLKETRCNRIHTLYYLQLPTSIYSGRSRHFAGENGKSPLYCAPKRAQTYTHHSQLPHLRHTFIPKNNFVEKQIKNGGRHL